MQGPAQLDGIPGTGYVVVGAGPQPEVAGEFRCGGEHTVDLRDAAGRPVEYTGPVIRPGGRRTTETLRVLIAPLEEYRPTIRVRITAQAQNA